MNSRRILNSVCICVHDLPKMQVKLLMWGALLSSIANSRRILNSLCICACQKCRLNAPKWEALLSSIANSRRILNSLCVCVDDLPKMQVKCAEVGSFAELLSELKTEFAWLEDAMDPTGKTHT